MRPSPEERFWAKVDRRGPDDCWEWSAYTNRGGYGTFHVSERVGQMLAHRYSYELHFGLIKTGMKVLHECDTPACVNPGHLILGTQKDNVRDMIEKGRQRPGMVCGEDHGRSVLTDKDVISIRSRASLGERTSVLAKEFGVVDSAISSIKSGRKWKHLL